MPRSMVAHLTIPGAESREFHLVHGRQTSAGEGEDWFIEMPVVLELLRSVQRGDIAASAAADVLLEIIGSFSEKSGCCPECEDCIPHYENALKEYEAAVAAERVALAAMTPQSHPFVISSSGKIHTWDCGSHPHVSDIRHPGATLQDFVHGESFRGINWNLRGNTHSVRVTADDVVARFRGRRTSRCKLCAPALPWFSSEASDVEATGR